MPKKNDYVPVRVFAVQGKRGPTEGGMKYTCSSCKIDYIVKENLKPICPLCEADDINASLRVQIDLLAQELTMVQSELERARAESDIVQTMRSAISVADIDDLVELKAIAYRWRSDPDDVVVLTRRSRRGNASLFVKLRSSNNESVFSPTSVGGVAFVAAYSDLVKARGAVRAMDGYAEAIASRLA